MLSGFCRMIRFCENVVFAVVMLATGAREPEGQQSAGRRAFKSETWLARGQREEESSDA